MCRQCALLPPGEETAEVHIDPSEAVVSEPSHAAASTVGFRSPICVQLLARGRWSARQEPVASEISSLGLVRSTRRARRLFRCTRREGARPVQAPAASPARVMTCVIAAYRPDESATDVERWAALSSLKLTGSRRTTSDAGR